ncbi:MAG: sigma-70 family RNA polymerase sigma factor [Nibricoccus sp.]
MIDDDHELLRQYATSRSEPAFAELVRRHLDLVYAAALRQTDGNIHLSREIAQSVFTDLARKAGSLNRSTILVGWLHTAVRFAASKAMRSAARREHHERLAATEMNADRQHHSSEDAASLDPAQLQPVIDAAIGELKPREREAVLMRFFERRELADLGSRLALSESAARSCVDRALKKMRASLERRGVKSSVTALALALGEQTATAAPAGLAATVTSGATAAAAVTGVSATAFFLTMTKLQYALIGALAIGSGIGVAVSIKLADRERELAGLRPQASLLEETKRENQALKKRLADAEAALTGMINRSAPPETQSAAVPAVTAAPALTNASIEKELIAVEECRNVGSATAATAFQTLVWAALTGDDDTLASLVFLPPESLKLGTEYLQQLPEETRRQFKSPQHVVALFLAEEIVRKASKVQVIRTTPVDESRVSLRVRTTNKGNDDKPRESAREFVRIDAQWRVSMETKMVEQLFNKLRQKAAASH